MFNLFVKFCSTLKLILDPPLRRHCNMQRNWDSKNLQFQMGGCIDGIKGNKTAYLTYLCTYLICSCNISIHFLTPEKTCMTFAYHRHRQGLQDFQLSYNNLVGV